MFKEMRNDQDLIVEEKYGIVAAVIAKRAVLARNFATSFILLQFMRRSVQAFIVLWFYATPIY